MKILKYFVISLALFFVLILAAVNLPFSQNIITKKVNGFLHDKNIPAEIGRIKLLITGKIGFDKVQIIKVTGDTIVFSDRIRISAGIVQLLFKKVKVKNVTISDAVINITMDPLSGEPDIISLFTGGSELQKKKGKQETTGKKKWEISVSSVSLKNVQVVYHDAFKGIRIAQSVGKLFIRFDEFSLINRQIHAAVVELKKVHGSVTLNNASGKKIPVGKSASAGWKFRLRRSDLKDIEFALLQPDQHRRFEFSLVRGDISKAGFDLGDTWISLESVQFDEPRILLFSSPVKSGYIPEPDTSRSDFPGALKISGIDFKINDGFFQTETYDYQAGDKSKNSHFQIERLNTTLQDILLTSQESRFKMNRLSFELNNGLKIDKGEISFSSDSTLKSRLEANITTASSRINLKAEAGKDLASLIRSRRSVVFALDIDNTEISAGDILSFLPEPEERSLLTKNKTLRLGISLNAKGTTDLFKIGKFNLNTSNGLTLSLSGEVTNILKPKLASCSVEFNAGPVTRSGIYELLKMTGSSIELPEFDPITVKSTIAGSLMAPDFLLTMESQSGNITVDGSIHLSEKVYDLKLEYSDVDLGKLAGISDLKKISGHFEVSGTELVPERLKVRASFTIDSAGYRGYNYHDVNVEFDGDHGLYRFGLNSSDTSFKCDLTGTYSRRDSTSRGQVSGIFGLDAGSLNLFSDISASGVIEGNIMNSPSGLNASVSIRNLVMGNSRAIEDLEHLDLTFQSSDTAIKGIIESDFLKAAFHSAGSLSNLQAIFKKGRLGMATIMDSSAQKRIPYISALPQTSVSIESTYDPVIGLVLNDTIFSYHKISAKMIKDTSGFARADILIDRFNFGSGSGFGTNIHIGTLPGKSVIMLSADSIKYGKIKLAGMQADISTAGDSAMYRFKAGDKDNRPLYDISGVGRKSEDKVKLRSTQAQWILNGFNWNVYPGDFLILDPEHKDFTADLHWKNDEHSIDIYGVKSEKLNLELNNVGISTLLIPGMNVYGFDGELTGKIEYHRNKNSNLGIQMDINQMKIAESKLGNLKITGNYLSDTTGKVESDIRVVMNDTSSIKLAFSNTKDNGQKRFSTDFSGLPLNVFQSFVVKYISGLKGEISGGLSLTSEGSKPQLNGEIQIRNTGLRIVPLNAQFYMPDDVIKLENSKLVFSQFTVIDSLKKRLTVSGNVDLNDPGNIISDLIVTSDLLQVMNTSGQDNKAFNGSVFINSKLRISGPVLKPVIKGNIVLAEGTVINYRYAEDLSVSETQKVITFASLTNDQSVKSVKEVTSNMLSRSPDIEASVEIDPKSLFNFQISRGFDIGVSIRGGGFLTYSLMPNRAMDLTGTYEINQGSAELKIPGWPRKDFIITPGSFMKWDGKIDDPELQVETTSKVRGSYINPVDGKTREVNFLVYMKLSENLSQLEIMFDVRSEDQYITSVFNSLSADERMRQAINLLIFGSIQLPNLSSSSDYVTQQINQFWESQLNQITKSAIKKVDVSIGVDTYTGASEGGGEQTYTSLSYQVKKDMFRDRGSVLVSGHMNDNSPASQQSNNVIENFIFEYALDTNRTKYLKIYRQQNYEDLLEGEVTKSGVGFIYRKNYDKLSDIWRRKKKPKK